MEADKLESPDAHAGALLRRRSADRLRRLHRRATAIALAPPGGDAPGNRTIRCAAGRAAGAATNGAARGQGRDGQGPHLAGDARERVTRAATGTQAPGTAAGAEGGVDRPQERRPRA